jgi:hypothetical protein
MKQIPIAIFITSFLFVNAKISPEKRREMLIKSFNDCKEREKGSESDLASLLATKEPETLEGHCMIACSLEDFAIVS